jgi:hypothetical protein
VKVAAYAITCCKATNSLLLLLLLYLWLQARVGCERGSVRHHLLHSHQQPAAAAAFLTTLFFAFFAG